MDPVRQRILQRFQCRLVFSQSDSFIFHLIIVSHFILLSEAKLPYYYTVPGRFLSLCIQISQISHFLFRHFINKIYCGRNSISSTIESGRSFMFETIVKYLDIPFIGIFLMCVFVITAWTGVSFFQIQSYFLLIPLELFTLYVIILVMYWVNLFFRSKQFQDELEVFELIQKKSLSLALSMELNLCFSVYYFYVAYKNHSSWFSFVAFFYISLTIARFILLREFCFEIQSLISQYKRYMAAGYMMLIMMICLFLMSMMAVQSNYVVSYPGNSIYISAAFSMYLIVTAVKGYRRYKKYRSPLLSGNQMISISAALLGILSLQTAFLPRISQYADDIHKMNIVTGCIIFAIMITMSLYMIIHGGRVLAHGLDKDGNRIDAVEEDLS